MGQLEDQELLVHVGQRVSEESLDQPELVRWNRMDPQVSEESPDRQEHQVLRERTGKTDGLAMMGAMVQLVLEVPRAHKAHKAHKDPKVRKGLQGADKSYGIICSHSA